PTARSLTPPPPLLRRSAHPPTSPLFPSTTLFRSATTQSLASAPSSRAISVAASCSSQRLTATTSGTRRSRSRERIAAPASAWVRSEEHTSELQSLTNLVCRLLLEKKNTSAAHPLS